MRKLMIALVLGLVGIFAIPQQSQANRLRRMKRFLKLSEAQVTKIRNIMYSARRTQIQTKAKLQLARLDLHQLVSQHRPNLKAVSTALDKVGAIELTLKKSRVMMMLRIKATLSSQQAEKLEKFNNRRKMRRRRMRRRFRRWMRGRRWRNRRRRRQMRRRWRRNRRFRDDRNGGGDVPPPVQPPKGGNK